MSETKRTPSLNTALAREYVGNLKKTLLRDLKTDDPLERWVSTFVHDVRESRSISALLKKTVSEKAVFNAVKRLLAPQLKKAKAEAKAEAKREKKVVKKAAKKMSAPRAEHVSKEPENFTESVMSAANTVPWREGAFSAFISDTFDAWKKRTRSKIELEEFKRRLRENDFDLSRADLVETMPQSKVSRSRISVGSAELHLINLPFKWDAC